jgi:hypothetical protein
MKSIFFSLTLTIASIAGAVPKAPKVELKKEVELAKCQEQLNALSDTSNSAEKAAAAQCQFWIAEQGYAKFTALKLPTIFDKDNLAKWIEDSKTQRQETSALYLKVKDLNNKEQSIAALARLGLMSYQFATNIQSSPLPTMVEYDSDGDGTLEFIKVTGELKIKVHETVKGQLALLSKPIFEDAKKAFDGCVQEAKDNKINNNWSKLCVAYTTLLTPVTKEPVAKEKVTPSEPMKEDKAPEVLFK